jgi:hypothetical protein
VDPPPPRPASGCGVLASVGPGPRGAWAGLGRIMIRVGRQLGPVPQWALYWGDSEGFISSRSKPATGVTATEVRPLALRLACQVYYSGACQWGRQRRSNFQLDWALACQNALGVLGLRPAGVLRNLRGAHRSHTLDASAHQCHKFSAFALALGTRFSNTKSVQCPATARGLDKKKAHPIPTATSAARPGTYSRRAPGTISPA